jgi:RNA polymerase sigma-70 factor (ECF subfamily)
LQRSVTLKRVIAVTKTLGQWKGGVIPADPEREFDEFFRVECARLIGQAYVYTGSLVQAQDLAHETLTRVWQRWDALRSFDDPGAWARKVLYNLATSEWRRAQVRRREEAVPRPIEGPDVEALALAQALRTLPVPQRHAIVLHDAMGVPVSDIALELDVPEGTVRSWLTRGRRLLAIELRISDDREDVISDVKYP